MSKFQIWDKVVSIRNTPNIPEGFIGYIFSTDKGIDWDYMVRGIKDGGAIEYFNEDELELLSVSKDNNIARPILDERKVGKVQMSLYDEGFPNAIMEVAKVMSWAAEYKGYKPHDWKSLPNADTEFSAAASRHKVKGFIQKVNGVHPLQRTDEESNIAHLAHTAFNVLAELELVLTGVIKN